MMSGGLLPRFFFLAFLFLVAAPGLVESRVATRSERTQLLLEPKNQPNEGEWTPSALYPNKKCVSVAENRKISPADSITVTISNHLVAAPQAVGDKLATSAMKHAGGEGVMAKALKAAGTAAGYGLVAYQAYGYGMMALQMADLGKGLYNSYFYPPADDGQEEQDPLQQRDETIARQEKMIDRYEGLVNQLIELRSKGQDVAAEDHFVVYDSDDDVSEGDASAPSKATTNGTNNWRKRDIIRTTRL